MICTVPVNFVSFSRCNLCNDIVLRELNELLLHFHARHDGFSLRDYFSTKHNFAEDEEDPDQEDDEAEDGASDSREEEQHGQSSYDAGEDNLMDFDEDEAEEKPEVKEEVPLSSLSPDLMCEATEEVKEEEKPLAAAVKKPDPESDEERILQWPLAQDISLHLQRLFDDHRCSVCDEKVKPSNARMNKHMSSQHGINLLQYYRAFILEEEEAFDACCHKCRLCAKFFSATAGEMRAHLVEEHEFEDDDAVEGYEDGRLSLELWAESRLRCHRCGDDVKHSRQDLEEHCRSKHGRLSLRTFFARWKTQLRLGGLDECSVKLETMSEDLIEKAIAGTGEVEGEVEGQEEEDFIEEDRGKEVIVTREVGNLCTFSCPDCSFKTRIWSFMKRHFKKRHMKGESRRLFHRDFFAQPLYRHKCVVCQKKVYCTTAMINLHIFKRHKIGPREYKEKLEEWRKKEGDRVSDGETRSEEGGGGEVPKGNKIQIVSTVADLSTFACNLCHEKFEKWSSIKEHLEEKHGYQKSTKMFKKTFVDNGIFHRCRVCHMTLICEQQTIRRHVSSQHGMKCDEYDNLPEKKEKSHLIKTTKEIIVPRVVDDVANLSTFSCDKCGETFKLWTPFRDHYAEKHGIKGTTKLAKKTFLSNGVLHQCRLCHEQIVCEKGAILLHLRYHDISLSDYEKKAPRTKTEFSSKSKKKINAKAFENLCTFRCPLCRKFADSNWDTTKSHAKEVHGLTEKLDQDIWTEKKVLHTCRLCGKGILHDRTKMRVHTRRVHRMSLAEYCSGKS